MKELTGANSQFNAPGSTFSKINGSANIESISGGQDPVNASTQIDPVSEINSQTSTTEGMMDSQNAEYKSTRKKEMVDPNAQANSEIDSNIKNPKPVNFEETTDYTDMSAEHGDYGVPGKVDYNVEEKTSSRKTSKTEQGWLERQAHNKINSWMSDAGSNVGENEGQEPKDPDTSTQKSKKPGVGKVPAIDQAKPKPSVPDTSGRPRPKSNNVGSPPSPKVPKFGSPKFKMPKMKLR